MEDFINKLKRLLDELKSREITLPNELILTWILEALPSDYENFVSSITQQCRVNPKAYNLSSLTSTLLDESKRISSNSKRVLFTKSNSKSNSKGNWKSNNLNRVNNSNLKVTKKNA